MHEYVITKWQKFQKGSSVGLASSANLIYKITALPDTHVVYLCFLYSMQKKINIFSQIFSQPKELKLPYTTQCS